MVTSVCRSIHASTGIRRRVFLTGRANDLITDIRDDIVISEFYRSQYLSGGQPISELDEVRSELKTQLSDARQLRDEASAIGAVVFIGGSLLSIIGFVVEKWRKI